MAFFKCFKFSPLINFQSSDRHWSVVLDKIQLQLDREEAKEREDGELGGEGQYYYSREAIISNISIKGGGGDYLREAINLSSDSYYSKKYSKHLF